MSLVPLLEVTWPMFFLGDQLCSHARVLNDFFVFSCVSITNPSYSNITCVSARTTTRGIVDDLIVSQQHAPYDQRQTPRTYTDGSFRARIETSAGIGVIWKHFEGK
jgi:hypothetical protein